MNVVLTFAAKEFFDHLRNGWVIFLAVAFTLFAFVITVAGFGFTGQVGTMNSVAALQSLTSLSLYLIPLMGLLLGYDAIVGEKERGVLDLLRVYPVSAWQIGLGKLTGLGSVLALTLAIGLIVPALLAFRSGGGANWVIWPLFLGLSVWLGVIFVALALLISSLASERGSALGLGLALWLVLVLLFDLGVIGLLIATEGALPQTVLQGLFILNPASLFRVVILGLLLGEDALQALGVGSEGLSWPLLWGGVFFWTVLPPWLATIRLGRME